MTQGAAGWNQKDQPELELSWVDVRTLQSTLGGRRAAGKVELGSGCVGRVEGSRRLFSVREDGREVGLEQSTAVD
ncbi:hypothetical protein MAPG_11529 [Magnaporthiopsis poae ATCC 64411]|uniref:Uncharacterized protein n=1 Tax=Magnaporthiopsis poae (strain ATCC 64411 / 73-15) TaxID=644358 RepID=A0A0C4EFI0_MAGP6|nr:hypothetical protein MAPG_11529 [Magnaporthiopsis poae ATCC 64411]